MREYYQRGVVQWYRNRVYFNKPRLTTLQPKSIALFQVFLCLPEHPDGKRELEVRIRNRTSPIEDPFNSLLCP